MICDRQLSSLQLAIAVSEPHLAHSGVWRAIERRHRALWLEVGRLASLGVIAAPSPCATPRVGPLPLSAVAACWVAGVHCRWLPARRCVNARGSAAGARWDADGCGHDQTRGAVHGYKAPRACWRPAIRLPCLSAGDGDGSLFHSPHGRLGLGVRDRLWPADVDHLGHQRGTTDLLSGDPAPCAATRLLRSSCVATRTEPGGPGCGRGCWIALLPIKLPRDRPG